MPLVPAKAGTRSSFVKLDSRLRGNERSVGTIASHRHARPCAGHPRLCCAATGKSWMAGTSDAKTALRAFRPAMTNDALNSSHCYARAYRSMTGCRVEAFQSPVIPGRAESANPKSRNAHSACIWIPGPALPRRPGMTKFCEQLPLIRHVRHSGPASPARAQALCWASMSLPRFGIQRRGWPEHRRAKHAVLRTAMPGHDVVEMHCTAA